MNDKLLLVTPARNETHSIRRTIGSVLAQTMKPWRYYLVSDGSDDGTDEIMQDYAKEHDFIHYLRREKPEAELSQVAAVSPGKVGAIESVLEKVRLEDWNYLGILDADVELPAIFYSRLLGEFNADEGLGLAGGFLRSILPDGVIAPGGFINPSAVGGPAQTFRRQCYEDIGGYKSYGHEDCIAIDEARDKGWKVRSFSDLVADHHVPFEGYAPTARYKVPALYKLGKMDFVMYVPAWFVLIQSTARCFGRPYLVAGIARFGGYLSAVITQPSRTPPQKSWVARQKAYAQTIGSKVTRIASKLLGK